MFRIYIKTAWRNIFRNKTFSALNSIGLAISLTAVILMGLYIEDELSFDRFHKNAANVYRVADDKQTPDLLLRSAQTAAPVAPALLREFPEIEHGVRLIKAEALIKYNEKLFEERNIYYADESIFNVFSFPLLRGNPANALTNPGTVVLTASTAKKYFGEANAIGNSLLVDGKNFIVTGVMSDIPPNSHLQFDFLISMKTAEEKTSGYNWLFTNWYSNNFYTYLLLPDNYDVNRLSAQMKDFDKRHREPGGNTKHHYTFEKLTDIYLHSARDNQAGKTGSITNLYIFSAIAVFILLIACINFINLSTARATSRAKEVAVKKVAGAAKSQVAAQFLTESFFICGISLVIAMTAAYILMPAFNTFSGKIISLHISTPLHITVLLLLFLVVGLLSGIYPAFVLSGFKPVIALKGKITPSAWSVTVRKTLVVSQFAVSVVLIICSFVVYRQMNYLKYHDLGFSTAQMMVINFEGDNNVKQRVDVIKQELLTIPGVEQVTASSNVPGDGNAGTWSMSFIKKSGDTIHSELPIYLADFNYLNQYEIPVVAGKAFSEKSTDDSVRSMLINESAVTKLGFRSKEEAIGVTVGMYPNDAKITGIVKDFHFESLQKEVVPLAMRVIPSAYRLLSVKINTDNIQRTVASVEAKWRNLVPERPLEFSFLDEAFNNQYRSEVKFGHVFNLFAALAIVIACLGLFGLALYSVQQRAKEIGVRKVLGANIVDITATLSGNFIRLVIIGIAIASPVAWYLMHLWLNNFAYRTDISVWIFVVAGLSAIGVALITISYQTIRAAMANPVKSLRTE